MTDSATRVSPPIDARAGDVPPQTLARFLSARRHALGATASDENIGRRGALRREMVASRAGLSLAYYTRLEQGRDHAPSRQVMLALARALTLSPRQTTYALSLAGLADHVPLPSPLDERTANYLHGLLDSIGTAALVDSTLRVLDATPAIAELDPRYRPGGRLMHELFADSDTSATIIDRDLLMKQYVSRLHNQVIDRGGEAPLLGAVQDIWETSPRFRELWEDQTLTASFFTTVRIELHGKVVPVRYTYADLVAAPGYCLHLLTIDRP